MSRSKIHYDYDNEAILVNGERVGKVTHEGISFTLYMNGKREGGFAYVRDMDRHVRKMLRARK